MRGFNQLNLLNFGGTALNYDNQTSKESYATKNGLSRIFEIPKDIVKNEDIMRRKRQKLDDHNINTQSILKDAMNDIKAFDK